MNYRDPRPLTARGRSRLLTILAPACISIAILVTFGFTSEPADATASAAQTMSCSSEAGRVTWTDTGASTYWVYRSTDDGSTFSWIGRWKATDPGLNPQAFTDRFPVVGAKYQVRRPAQPATTCSTVREPTQTRDLECVDNGDGSLRWNDLDAERYWIYRSDDDGATWYFRGRSFTTNFADPAVDDTAIYQVHFAGFPRTRCQQVPPSNPFGGLPFTSGQVEAADYAQTAEAIDIWNYVTNGFHQGSSSYDSSTDTQIVHLTSGGDPLPALDGLVHTGYRRMQTDGPQALWDKRNQPDHTRSQLGGWGRYSTLHVSEADEREFIVFSVRLDPDSPILGSVETKTGLFWLSMVSQFKSIGPSGNGGPTIAVYEGYDGLQLKVRDGNSTRYIRITDVPRGVWLRIGIDVLWSSDGDGAYRWWGDLDGDATVDFVPLSDRQSATTILPGFEASAFNIGPYHSNAVPVNGRDYANIEVLSHPVDDPWG